jgi:hypothetical protein
MRLARASKKGSLRVDLLDELVRSVLRDRPGEFFQQRPRKRLCKVEVERFIEVLLEILRNSPDVLQGGSNEVDGRDVGQRWARRVKLPFGRKLSLIGELRRKKKAYT